MKCPHCGRSIRIRKIMGVLGSIKSEAKAKASRENGHLGGRPRKDGKPPRKAAARG